MKKYVKRLIESRKRVPQDERMYEYGDTLQGIKDTGSEIDKMLTAATGKLREMKRQANAIKMKTNRVVFHLVDGLHPTTFICPATGAQGWHYSGMDEQFFTVDQAARYLSTTAGKVMDDINDGRLYSLHISNELVIPQGALNLLVGRFCKGLEPEAKALRKSNDNSQE